jgi:tRNA 2-thiouridine synthesizing protein C
MASNSFLFGEAIAAERLSWLSESLKYFFVNLHPDALRHPSRDKNPFFVFFLTGDAVYSLHDEETLPLWDLILSLPSVWLVCDREELDLRGLSVSSLKMKYPNQVFDQNGRQNSYPRSFWREIVRVWRQIEPGSGTFGYLQLSSPYMNRSSQYSLTCLHAAIEEQMAPELYGYLDGIHVSHTNQKPAEFKNIGENFLKIKEIAGKKNLPFLMLACSRCAAARGYSTWDDGKGIVISTCSIEPCKIRNLNVIIDRFRRGHPIAGGSAGIISISKTSENKPGLWIKKEPDAPSQVIVITYSPYGTEYTFGGLSFAIASAHQGIATRVIFLENGIYALTGTHATESDDIFFNIQDVIDTAAGSKNLELYAHMPSLQKRSIQKNKRLKGVLDIGTKELAQLLFSPPKGVYANQQRILFF